MTDQLGRQADRSDLEALLALQDLDVRLQQLRHRRANLPERQALAAADAALAALQAEHDVLEEDRSRLAGQRDALDDEAGATRSRIAAIEDRLRSAAAGSFRDQEAMATEVAALVRRREEIEDHELSVMEELEPVELALGELAARRRSLAGDRLAASEAYRVSATAAEEELAAAEAARGPVAAGLEPGLLATYERLAERLGGVAVARVVHGTCDGCRLSLSATELDHLRHAGSALAHCEQCGRILVA